MRKCKRHVLRGPLQLLKREFKPLCCFSFPFVNSVWLLFLYDCLSGDCARSSGGRSMWGWPHGGTREVPLVSSCFSQQWMKGWKFGWAPSTPRWPLVTSTSWSVLKPAALHRRQTLLSLCPAVMSSGEQGSWSCSGGSLTQLRLSCLEVVHLNTI